MKTNQFKIALRFLLRNKTFSILNFACLTFGLTCSILAALFILNALSFDKFHKNYDRLFAIESYVTYFNGDRFAKQYQSAAINDEIKQQAPEIEELTRLVNRSFTFADGEKTFTENGLFADNNFFNLFSFPFIKGNNSEMATNINTIMISERMAKKFFESTDCIGKTLILKEENKQEAFKIIGILKNVPRQSFLQFDYVIPFANFLANNSWANEPGAASNQVWALIKNNVDKSIVEGKIKNLIKNQEASLNQELFLFPLKDKILYRYVDGKKIWDEMRNLFIVGSIAFAILLIACFNFINLAIALNIKRYREAGIKKVIGSTRTGIIFQFLRETFLITIISLLSAILISRMLINLFNTAFNNDIHFNLVDAKTIVIFTAITLFTGLVSGILPSLYLSSSNPIDTLKGRVATRNSYSLFRQGLIVFQFTIPIVMIICMLIVRTQDKFLRNFDAGIAKDNVIILDKTENITKHAERFRADLLSIPGIDAVSFTNCLPTRGTRPINDVSWEGIQSNEKLHFWCVNTDFDYTKIVKVKMDEGRFFDRSHSYDSACYLINDVAAKVMKYNNPVGSTITVEGKQGSIIGVFSDFHAIDLSGPLVPTIMRIQPTGAYTAMIKFSSATYPEIVDKVSKVYKQYEPELSFSPQLFRQLTEVSELNVPSKLIGVAFIIAMLLACLGLSGLVSFTAASRTKEIGIRKTNGASTLSVMQMLLGKYSKWLIIAFLFALPLAFVIGNIFLARFYFHAPMPIWAFILGPFIAFFVALSAVWFQSWKAATRNPVEALRYE